MSDVIELRGLRVTAVVGVLAEERLRRQPLEIDLDLERDFTAAAAGDNLGATTNYAAVLERATAVAVAGQFQLLETLAVRVAEAVLALDPEITAVTVAVRKLRPPVPDDVATVGVRHHARRT